MRTTLAAILAAALSLSAGTTCRAADVETITHGRAVDLEDHLVPGKFVLFDFYADWCGPCRVLGPQLLDLAGRHADRLVLRKVDVVNWDSEVARQYRMSSIPYLVLYGPDGNRLAAGDAGSVLNQLQAALGNGGGGRPAMPAMPGRGTSAVPFITLVAALAVALALVARRRLRQRAPTGGASAARRPTPVDTAADPGDPAIWFAVLQESLEGPFTRGQLSEMVRGKVLDRNSRVRRRGDADWSSIEDVLD